jgi:predicted DNA-binding protein
MEQLTKKTTILFPPALHRHLSNLSKARGVSIGELIRSAVEAQYGLVSREAQIKAAAALRRMSLPVGTVRQMNRESMPEAEEPLP